VGQATLLRFYLLHVALLPTGLLLLLALHLWRIRRDGGLARDGDTVPAGQELSAWPHLVLREGILILVILAGFCLLAALVDAPLGGLPDLHHPDNPEKAPWYFLWLQEMVSYSAVAGGVIYPGLLLGLLVAIPFLDREDRAVGRWFGSGRVRTAAAISFGLALLGFTGFEALHLGSGGGAAGQGLGSEWINPATGMLVLAGLAFWLGGALTRSTRAACACAFVVLATGVAGFVFVGACRGPDWIFYWPWEAWPLGA